MFPAEINGHATFINFVNFILERKLKIERKEKSKKEVYKGQEK
jgi:hypothetical protein